MASHSPARRRFLLTTWSLLPAVAVWGLAAWFARDGRRWAIELTNYLFALALLVSYVAGWSLRITWARGRPRHATFQATTATLVLLVLLLIVEVPAFLGLIDYSRQWESWTGNWRGPAYTFDVDLELAFRRCPNMHSVGRSCGDIAGAWNMPCRSPRQLEFTFNAQGFRSRTEYTTADVVMLGDSFIEGWFVSDGDTCSDKLAGRTGLIVANLAQSGYGTLQELRILQRHAPGLSPRLVIWFFYEGNDLYDDEDFEDAVAYYQQVGGTIDELRHRLGYRRTSFREASFSINTFVVLRRSCDWLVPNNMPNVGWFRDDQGIRQRILFYNDYVSQLGDYELGRFEKTKQALATGKALCDERGMRLLVCYIPTKFRVYREFCEFAASSPCRAWQLWDLPERFAGFCGEAGIPFLNLTAAMQEAAGAGRLLYAPSDSHWDRAGHAFVARLLEENCRDIGLTDRGHTERRAQNVKGRVREIDE